ncbi:hypothetical protein ACIBG0_36800 [Nocardia sp. NPDC050630]|uniref:hypothetical protein n=1 Tax=Nocardia sp. NPDC050630 TaxID=3364321 RepID=UPI0037A082BB
MAETILHRWCPPSQRGGRYRALLQTLDPTYTWVQTEHSERFATTWLARRWLQHHSCHAGDRSPSTPRRATIDEMDGDRLARPGIYEACGPALDVVATLTVLADVRPDCSPVTGHCGTDGKVLFSLIEEYEWCLAQLRSNSDPILYRYRAVLRNDIGAVLATGAISTAAHEHASIRLHRADLTRLICDDGAFRAVIDRVTTGHPESVPVLATVRRLADERFASARHAREYLIHTLGSEATPANGADPAALHAEVIDTRTDPHVAVYTVTGTATSIQDELLAVTDFDGTYLLGIPELDERLLTALVADYRHSAATLLDLATSQNPIDLGTDPHWQTRLYSHQQRRREITAMLTEPSIAEHTGIVTAQLLAADAPLGIHLRGSFADTDRPP